MPLSGGPAVRADGGGTEVIHRPVRVSAVSPKVGIRGAGGLRHGYVIGYPMAVATGGHMAKERAFGPHQLAEWLGIEPRHVRRAETRG